MKVITTFFKPKYLLQHYNVLKSIDNILVISISDNSDEGNVNAHVENITDIWTL